MAYGDFGTPPANDLDDTVIQELTSMIGIESYVGLTQRFFSETESAIVTFRVPENDEEFLTLKGEVHKLAGSAAALGAKRIHELLKQLEISCKSEDQQSVQEMLGVLPDVWASTKMSMSGVRSMV